MSSDWIMHASPERFDWSAYKDRINLEAVAVILLDGPPAKRQGGRLLWPCPFHDDHDPSFTVEPERGRWKCWPCNVGGDAAKLAMMVGNMTFPAAARYVAELCGLVIPSSGVARPTITPKPMARAPTRPVAEPSSLPLADAVALVEAAARRLWTPEGAEALERLRGPRGLDDETIRSARLGFARDVAIPTKGGDRCFRASGVVIPWFDGNRLSRVKIRQPEGREPKYAQAFGDRPGVYPSLAVVRPGRPLIVCEGEFDAMLLGQQIGDLASVVTTRSASGSPGPGMLEAARRCPVLYVAHDADDAGDRAAASWPARSRRVRPPAPCNDWGDLHASGFNRIRYLWGSHLPMSMPWEELAGQRWGPADDEHDDDPDGREEREAIQTESRGGLPEAP